MKGEPMDEEIGRAMLKTIKVTLASDTPTLDEFLDAFIRSRGDLLERFRDRLALQQLRMMFQAILDVCVAKGAEELRERGWKAGKP